MKRSIDKIAIIVTVLLLLIGLWLVIVFIINKQDGLEKHKAFYWFGWCPPQTSEKFDQTQNVFTQPESTALNNVCCPSGYYGMITLKGKNICCRNKFMCDND